MLTFDENSHQYYWDDQPVVNVTRVLSGLVDYSHIHPITLELAQQQGTAIHKMVEQDCKGNLATESLPEWMRKHYEAWVLFKDETGFECIESERRLYHPTKKYAGTTDIIGLMPKIKGKGVVLIDIKRSFYAGAAIGLQLAGYADAWNVHALTCDRIAWENRFALRLDDDGKYRLRRFSDPDDFFVFTAQLATYRWREKNHDYRGWHE